MRSVPLPASPANPVYGYAAQAARTTASASVTVSVSVFHDGTLILFR